MMVQRPLRGLVALAGLLGAGLTLTALAGCGSVVASAGDVAAVATPTSVPRVGCASVNQATAVSIRWKMDLKAPAGTTPISAAIDRRAAKVQALFGQMCAAVTHPARLRLMHCPADFGTEYAGTFYDGSRVLATFTYFSSGCQRVSVTAAGKTLATWVYGRAAAAAPHLLADLDAIVGAPKPGMMQPQGSINPGGPNRPA